jgi:signal transduction histidine kinase
MDDALALDIRDDGRGFDPSLLRSQPTVSGGVGLVGMQERVEALHGSLTVESAPAEGTAVVIAIPAERGVPPVERSELKDATAR